MKQISSYPLAFETEETLSQGSYGKTGRQYRLPSSVATAYKGYHKVCLASLEHENSGVEFMVSLEKPPGTSFQEGHYLLRQKKDGKYFLRTDENQKRVSQKEIFGSDFVFHTLNELKFKLALEIRKSSEFNEFNQHAIGRVSIYYPHMTKKLQSETEALITKKLVEYLPTNVPGGMGVPGFNYTTEFNVQNGYLEAMIYASGKLLESDYRYKHFLTSIENVNREVNDFFFNDLSFNVRKKKGLSFEGLSWYVCEDYLKGMSTQDSYYSTHKNPKNGSLFEVMYKGVSVGIQVKNNGNSDDLKYIMYVEENGQKRKKISGYEVSSPSIREMLASIQKYFLDTWNQRLEDKMVVKELKCRRHGMNYLEWNEKISDTLVSEIQDVLEYGIYGEVGYLSPTSSVPRKCVVTFISTSELLQNERINKKLDVLLENVLS